jgi:hypothetical protein
MTKEGGQPTPPDDLTAEQAATLNEIAALHPDLAGGMLMSKTGIPYNPANVPNTPEALNFYRNTEAPTLAGQPGAPPVEDAEPEEKEVAVQPAPPSPTPPKPGRLLADKYINPEELERGYHNLLTELTARNAENTALKAVNQHIEALTGGFRGVRETPSPQFLTGGVTDDGRPTFPLAELRQMIDDRAREIANEQVQAHLTPLAAVGKASTAMREGYPEFVQEEQKFARWLKANPDIAEKVADDPEFAMEAAYLKYNRILGQTNRVAAVETTQASTQAINEVRKHAASITGSAARRAPLVDTRTAAFTALYKQAQETGDNRPIVKARLEEAIGADLLNSMEKSGWGR